MHRPVEGIMHRVRQILLSQEGLRDSALVVGVSGGLDSMVLLHVLAHVAPRLGIRIEAAHCHHGLRGRAADLDEKCVQEATTKLRVGFHTARFDVRGAADHSGESIEMAARRLRHRFLARTAVELGSRWVALAHHADDQAELVLLRLFRGAGSDGLSGMSLRSPSPADDRVQLLRPLLGFSRSELEEVAGKRQIRFRKDRSNLDPTILRNRIRHRILPFLCRQLTPALPRILNRVAEIAAAESEHLEAEATHWRQNGREDTFGTLSLALQRIVLRQRLLELGQIPDFDSIESLRTELRSPSRLKTPGGPEPVRDSQPTDEASLDLRRKGAVPWRSGLFRWTVTSKRPGRSPGTECLDADRVGIRAKIRIRRTGDFYQPLGMPAPSRLKNLLMARKVPRGDRDSRFVIEIPDGRIAWVEGLPPGETFKHSEKTRRWLRLWWEPGD